MIVNVGNRICHIDDKIRYNNYSFNSLTRRYNRMIQDDIIKELQYIPEARLNELYELIHSFRLRFNSEGRKSVQESSLAGCLKSYSDLIFQQRKQLNKHGKR